MARRTVEQADQLAHSEFAEQLTILREPLWATEAAKVEQDRLNAERYAAWRRLYPGKKVPRTPGEAALQLGTADDAIKQPYVERADAEYKRRKAARDAAEERMRELAPDIALHVPTGNWQPMESVSVHSYPNQTADHHYSHVSALLKSESWGLHAPMRVIESNGYFRIEADVADEFECAVLRYRPGLTLRQWMQSCMRHGCNVRVFFPGLAWGIEERLGLDNFGNDLKGWKQ